MVASITSIQSPLNFLLNQILVSTITQQEKVQKPTICMEIDAYSFLGLTRPSTGRISGEGHNNKQ
jgi:hypothetical protein